MLTLVILLLVLALILLAIIRYEIHPFLALFGGAIGYGLLVGMDLKLILQSITEGFGGVMGSVGLLILLGVILGTFLEKTGGAMVLAEKVLSWVGEKSINLSLMLSGWVLSIPVFGDSTILMMNPIAKSLSAKSSVSYAATIVAVSLGAMISHSLVPPTPGPIATAGILGADLGLVILYGTFISLLALIPVHFFINRWVSRIPLRPTAVSTNQEVSHQDRPKLVSSLLPILSPLVLIFFASIANYPSQPLGNGTLKDLISFLGSPVIALFIGALLSFTLPKKLDRKLLAATGWLGEALVAAAPVIFITGAGAIFGKMLQNSGIGSSVTTALEGANWGLFLPFLLAFGLKCAQGSTTVAMITTASIVAPLLSPLGLDTDILKVFTTLAIGAGALAISHANDSAFWVVTQLSGMTTKQGNLSHSLGTLIASFSAMAVLYLISLIVV
ncbi:MAG: GntP family permease [Algoriphagus sp.]|jgi:gluconate:H+ symporter, GntP family|uniref:GntP family permease n=1 Tax=Algoriphagus sp. TaxID=1872435 RepID=UPI002775359A|nr:GntP family permease [Algoriphagus sp.]MDP4747314.1 GntP family permease [Algoriphagus sp.]MDP4905109.1 GntP family permease [Algoriphagus sp.]MDP4956713.1 GntP family permease [Algoriphagus sp.]MDP5124372.1 GntP family permease [Algoriphagus sp.]